MISLGGDEARIELEEEHGCILSLRSPRLGVELVRERRLARNFALLVPLPDLRAHYVWGHEQKLTRVEGADGGSSARLVWQGLQSARGWFDIAVILDVSVAGPEVTFRWTVENHSGHTVEEVRGPVLGGLHQPEERDDWRLHWTAWVGTGQEWAFYREFPGSYLGPVDPIWTAAYPGNMAMPWADLYNPKRGCGVYFGLHRVEPRRASLFAEITPGTDYGPRGQMWPRAERLGVPVAAALGWSTFAFARPGTTFGGGEVVVAFHAGDWSAAAERYRAWYDRHLPQPRTDGWLHEADAWQSTIISYPEDTVGYRFSDLPRMARVAKDHGIHVLQIDGWDIGGIDRGYPQYTPDPRLGTAEELTGAIRECRALGVHVMLFNNLHVANLETEGWASELRRYAVRDPWGHRQNGMGWEYGTILGLQGQCVPRMVPLNPAHARFRDIAVDQLLNPARLGAPGVQIDKVASPGYVDYHPDLVDGRGVSMQEGMLEVMRRFALEARAMVPDFDIASETHWDRMVPFMSATYSRFFSATHLPTFAHAFPEIRQSCCVTGPSDFNMVNNCLRYGHIVNIEGRCLHGTAADAPVTARYAAAALGLRRSLRHVLWDGRPQLPSAPGVRMEHDGMLAGRFVSADGATTALVLNHWQDGARRVSLREIAGRDSGEVTVHSVGAEPRRVSLPAELAVEPEQVLVVVA